MFDIPGQIRKAINEFLMWVAKTGLKPVMDALGATALSTPDLTNNEHVKAIWTTCLVAANGIYVLFVIAGAFIITSRESLQTQYGFKEIAPRLALGAVISNVSLILCGKAIEVTNALTAAIAGQGVDGPSAANAIMGILYQPFNGTSPNLLLALLVIAASILALIVVITFVLRVALMVVLVGTAPLALACHATPQTEGLAYTWWRAFGACLGLQVAQAVIVLATIKVFLTPSGLVLLGVPATASGLLGVLVCITMLWLLLKLPGLMKQFVLSPLGLRNQGRGLFGQLLQAYLTFKTLGAVTGLGKGKRAATAGAAARSGAGGGTGTAPARRVPNAGGRPPGPSPAPSRPSPAAPVAFSHAPATQTPLPAPAGSNGAPTFSHGQQPATPAPAPTGPASAARFSQPNPAQPATPRPPGRPAPVAFSNTPPSPASPTPAGPPPAATFSNLPAAQSAPRRPPVSVTPVFSSTPTPGRRPTAAQRPTTRPSAASGSQPPAPRPATTPAPVPRPSPSPFPRPRPSASPVFRPAPSPPPPPPARRPPTGGKP
ncbi:hypothetical protein ACNTMW_12775 [Planosporangium sp. 12N6]|uniref:hypothetical protein n=1 Tax=Planosporangium spinosum TaxID=3402278 RepID=UPI003CEE4895